MSVWSEFRHLLRKEFTLEFRNRYALFGVLLYLFLLVFIVYLVLGQVEPGTWNALYWITLTFVAVSTVARSFVQESPARQFYYYTVSSATGIILSKLLYNALLLIVLGACNLLLFAMLIGWPVTQTLVMIATTVLGATGISTAFTLMSSISSKTNNNVGIMAILSLPVIVPMLMMLIECSNQAMQPLPEWRIVWQGLGIVAALDAIVVSLALILFPYLWRD